MNTQAAMEKLRTCQRIVGRERLQEILQAVGVSDDLPKPDGQKDAQEFWFKSTIRNHCQTAKRIRPAPGFQHR